MKDVNEYEEIKDKHLYLNDSFNQSGRFDIKIQQHIFKSLFKSKAHNKTKIANRPKWDNYNSLKLYKKYFLDFSFNNFHSFSYLSIHVNTINETKIYEFYSKN